MTVVIKMESGDYYWLDRRLSKNQVAQKINEARGKGQLIEFESNLTPTGQMIWIDPDRVEAIDDNGSSY